MSERTAGAYKSDSAMKFRLFPAIATLALGFCFGVACDDSDDDGPNISREQACMNVIDACHTKDDGTDDQINACHQRAHDDGDCLQDYQDCIDVCNAADPVESAGSMDHGDRGDHGDHGGSSGGDHGDHGDHGGSSGDHGGSSGG